MMVDASQKFTLKVEYAGEVRRLRGWPENEESPTIEALTISVRSLFGLCPAEDEVLSLGYHDDEGDLCTLVSATLSDALCFASQSGTLRLKVHLRSQAPACQDSLPVEHFFIGELGKPAEEVCTSLTSEVEPEPQEPLPSVDLAEARTITSLTSEVEPEPQESLPSVDFAEARTIETLEAQLGQLNKAEEERLQLEKRVAELSERFAALEATKAKKIEAEEGQCQACPAETEQACPSTEPNTPKAPKLHDYAELVRQDACGQLSELHRLARERIEIARPHIAGGVAYLKQQVEDDFRSTSKDMKDAFGSRESQKVGNVCAVVGTAVATKLAHITETSPTAPTVDANHLPDSASENVAVESGATDLSHFASQVKGDFQSIRSNVSTALGCMLEPDTLESQQTQPRKTLKTEVSAAASSIISVGLAAWLIPVRAARFAGANLASAAASLSEQEDAAEQEAPRRKESQAPPQSSAAADATVE